MVQEEHISPTRLVILHLLPGALTMLLMLVTGYIMEEAGLFPSVPVMFTVIAPLLALGLIGFLFYKGKALNGRISLQGVVLYSPRPIPWEKTIGLACALFAWIAFIWYICKPALNEFFITHAFSWMPAYFFDDYFLNNLGQYSAGTLRALGILFTLSISLGGAVEELYFRGYLLPRMAYLGRWAPLANTVMFSLYHFWSPWENLTRLLGITPWIYTVWRTRNIYLSLLVHFVINAFSGLSLLSLIIQRT